jgi:hypothetical protein
MNLVPRFSILILLLFICGCGSTRTVMIGEARPATTPDAVRIYHRAPTRHFERIAIINASSGASWAFTTRSQADQAIAKLKEEAAKIGANGILLEWIGTSSSGNLGIGVGGYGYGSSGHVNYDVAGGGSFNGAILHKTAQATAIYVH